MTEHKLANLGTLALMGHLVNGFWMTATVTVRDCAKTSQRPLVWSGRKTQERDYWWLVDGKCMRKNLAKDNKND
ncbi:hypothetical protein E2C01_015008 [Portunus trituberculatus]|uniref:Uncharacterized protein n=1 Tax=Portunus trituberculatus TaxID=210409 RepID=A0A5B7DLT6_PORTR|nr:hypothetical protein [Portunus trituberculatus]